MKKDLIKINLISICIGLFFFIIIYFSKDRSRIDIMDNATKVEAIVIDKRFGYLRRSYFCTFSTSEKLDIRDYYECKNLLQEQWNNYLGSFLEPGDSISKKQGSDSVFVYRNKKEYIFIQTYFPDKK